MHLHLKQSKFLFTNHLRNISRLTYSDELVGVVHHGDKHVEQNHQRDDIVRAKHGRPDKLCKLVPGLDVGDVQVQQPEYGPEQRLKSLK